MTYKDLPKPEANTELPGGGTILARQPVLLCPACRETYSANPGDYWDCPKDAEILCDCGEGDEGGTPMVLAWNRDVTIPYAAGRDFDRMMTALWEA